MPNLFACSTFKDGGFVANDPKVGTRALHETIHAIDLGVDLVVRAYVFGGGYEGAEYSW